MTWQETARITRCKRNGVASLSKDFSKSLKISSSFLLAQGESMPDFIPKRDRDAEGYIDAVTDVVEVDETVYGLAAGSFAPVRSALVAFAAALGAADAAKSAAQIAVADKDNKRAQLEAAFRPLCNQIKAAPVVTDELLAQASLPIRDTVRTAAAPIAAAGVVARGGADGTNLITWQPNGNSAGARYRVESRTSPTGEFTLLDVVTATSFRHAGAGAGTYREYRIVTTRSNQSAAPSNTAVVFAA